MNLLEGLNDKQKEAVESLDGVIKVIDILREKCGNTHYCKGRLPFSRRCTKCKYDENPTAGTMFDKCKFSIELAFHIAFNAGDDNSQWAGQGAKKYNFWTMN